MTKIEERIEILQDICATLTGELQVIQTLRGQARTELDSDGGLTLETCRALSKQMISAEQGARCLDVGLKSVHQSMAEFVPEGMSEGNKKWPPEP